MQIIIDQAAGFCPGVSTAIKMAEVALKNGKLFSLGSIVHNDHEMSRLQNLGMITVSHEEMSRLTAQPIMFRAHGEPASSYILAQERGHTVIDATCPVVKGLQNQIARQRKLIHIKGGCIIIFGKKNHPEVIGLVAHPNNKTQVAVNANEISGEFIESPVHIFSQTTMNKALFEEFCSELMARYTGIEIHIHNSICSCIEKREQAMGNFAASVDVLVFVGGKHSSNAASLFEICQHKNPCSYFVSSCGEVSSAWFADAVRTGVTGASSTPESQLAKVADCIRNLVR